VTNNELITSAFRLAGVLDEVQALSAEQAANGLQFMNDLFLAWDGNGVDIGYFPQDDVADDTPIYADALMAARYGLALMVAAEYGTQPSAFVIALADSSYYRLLRDSIVDKQRAVDMSHLPSEGDSSDILTDS
jgi:hypothetical protein